MVDQKAIFEKWAASGKEIERGTNKGGTVDLMLGILKDVGIPIDHSTKILDFGCGPGWMVYEFRKRGLQAFGADIFQDFVDVREKCRNEGFLQQGELYSLIRPDPYRLPFDDQTFDVVVSDVVFEHVQNYPEALAEIYRVLKKGGVMLHFFPSRYRPIEPHVLVPLAGILRSRPYLRFWASLGIRNDYQKKMSSGETAQWNYDYLHECTNYLARWNIEKIVRRQFGNVRFVEALYLKHSKEKSGRIYRSLKWLPLLPWLFSIVFRHALFSQRTE